MEFPEVNDRRKLTTDVCVENQLKSLSSRQTKNVVVAICIARII